MVLPTENPKFQEIGLLSVFDSNKTENLYKYYDSELGIYRDIREETDDLCSIDSTAFYDKWRKETFTLLPRASLISRIWSYFWDQKSKANEGLVKAAKVGDVRKIQKLLNKLREPEKMAEITYCDRKGFSALHIAAKHNQYESLRVLLLSGEADINILTQNEERMTPLHIATIEQHLLIVKLLLQEFNANPNI